MNKQNPKILDINLIADVIEKGLMIDAVNIMVGIVITHSKNKKAESNLKDFVQSFAQLATPDEKELYQKEFDKRIDDKVTSFDQHLNKQLNPEEVKEFKAALKARIEEMMNGNLTV